MERPNLGNVNPGIANRPGLGNLGDGNRSGFGQGRPTTLPGNVAGIGNRPNLPSTRPTPLPAGPGAIGNRPVIGARPGIGDRPIIGGGNRPGIGDRPVIGGGNWINNHPGWGNWGGHGGDWINHWNDHHIGSWHHGWYHGCWHHPWYTPFAYGAAVWGAAALLPSWGYAYDYAYTNPYCTAPVENATTVYDYSQPISINTYETPSTDVSASQPPPEQAQGYRLFDQARGVFMQGDYRSALALDEQAIQKSPKDPALHEFGALCLFALGEYQRAASVLNALLAVAPGMDWTTMCGLYPDVEIYTKQLRTLEVHCQQQPDDTAAAFVLAYHYLVTGHDEAAANALRRVVAKYPNDQVAKQMLEGLTPPPAAPAQAAASPATEPPSTDLVGQWRAAQGSDAIELSIDEQSQFTWKARPQGKAPITISGKVTTTSDLLILESKDQGSLVGRVTSGGADRFQFVSTAALPTDKGLNFQRVKPGG